MRHIFVSLLLFLSISAISAQTHRQALEEFERLKQKAGDIKKESAEIQKIILQPEESDITAAKNENANVFRLLPREKYDTDVFEVRGGGAFYSFVRQSHDYNQIPQISLEQDFLNTGFYGASYGFLTDLGKIPLSEIGSSTKGFEFLVNYQPPELLSEARREKSKANGFEQEKTVYKERLPVVVGNTYLLRAISFDEADTLAAFNIRRKDEDGSLIIFWKIIKNFETPILKRDAGNSLLLKLQKAFRQNGFPDVQIEVTDEMIILRGTVPKGKMADAVRFAQEIGNRKVKNQLTEK